MVKLVMTMLWMCGRGRPWGLVWCSKEAASHRCGLAGENLLSRPARVQLRDIQRAFFRRACLEVRGLRELREFALGWLAAVPLLEPRRTGAQAGGDRRAAGREHAHHLAADALDLEAV